MAKAISWLEENEDCRKALLICDYKLLVNAVGYTHAPDGGKWLMHVAVAWFNEERCLEVLWVPDHFGLMGANKPLKKPTLGW